MYRQHVVLHNVMEHAAIKKHTHTQTHRQTHRYTHTDTDTHRHTHTETHPQTDTHTHRQTYRHRHTHTDRHTDRQTYRHTPTPTPTHRRRHTPTHTVRHTQTHRQTHTHTTFILYSHQLHYRSPITLSLPVGVLPALGWQMIRADGWYTVLTAGTLSFVATVSISTAIYIARGTNPVIGGFDFITRVLRVLFSDNTAKCI